MQEVDGRGGRFSAIGGDVDAGVKEGFDVGHAEE